MVMGEEDGEHDSVGNPSSEQHQGMEKSVANANHSGTTGLSVNETGHGGRRAGCGQTRREEQGNDRRPGAVGQEIRGKGETLHKPVGDTGRQKKAGLGAVTCTPSCGTSQGMRPTVCRAPG